MGLAGRHPDAVAGLEAVGRVPDPVLERALDQEQHLLRVAVDVQRVLPARVDDHLAEGHRRARDERAVEQPAHHAEVGRLGGGLGAAPDDVVGTNGHGPDGTCRATSRGAAA